MTRLNLVADANARMSINVGPTRVILSGYDDMVAVANAVCRVVYGTPTLAATVGKSHRVFYPYGSRELCVHISKAWKDPVLVHGGYGRNGSKASKTSDLVRNILRHLTQEGVVSTTLLSN